MHDEDFAVLDAETERQLAAAIEAGLFAQEAARTGLDVGATDAELALIAEEGRRAWERFLLCNTGLVWMLARREAVRCQVDARELFQEGFLALADALRRYDYKRGRFSTYAVPRIRHHVAQVACSRFGRLNLPPSLALARRRALGVAAQLEQELCRRPSPLEVRRRLGGKAGSAARVLDYQEPAALASWDAVALDDGTEAWAERADVRRCLRRLDPVERAVVSCRFGLGRRRCLTLDETARRLRRPRGNVRRVERRALDRLRAMLAPVG
ncbi:MAG: sigma-70 family RNA polymerase sigma factor [Propionibacteriaceae bacterium]|jgi:RNA polymerase primary sigma factor|nr:sigma-70 family RNA polymerase sigma factor [Propionibacteriaceae bacterium]